MASFLTTWVEGQRHRLRPGTWRRYGQYVRVHAIPVVGRVPLAKLGPHHLEKLYEDGLAAGLSPTTVHHLHTALHRAFSQAVRWGLLVRNPSDLLDSPRIARREMAVLSAEQVKQLLGAAAGGPLDALLTVAVTMGMRRGEILGLRWRMRPSAASAPTAEARSHWYGDLDLAREREGSRAAPRPHITS